MDPIEAEAFAGLTFTPVEQRVTSSDGVFQPILGDVNSANDGYSGIEYAYNDLLAGRAGSEIAAVAPGGITLPTKPRDVVVPHAGSGIVLTIDEPLQVETERDVAAEMRSTGADSGIAVIMDVHTGAILAMVDLVRARHGVIVSAPENLAVTNVYQPGSVMKLATVSFALQDGLITPSTVFTVPYQINVGGYEFQDADFHPTQPMPVSQILAQSSNVGTIEIAQRLGEQRLYDALNSYGFGHLTGLNWPGESAGIVGSPATWYGSSAASVPIGTGIAVTPLQILDAYNAVANDGVFVTPHLVQGLVNDKGVEHLLAAHVGRRVIDTSTVRQLVPMLEGVVQDGTAVLAHIPGYTVAGKTGTAQVPDPTGLGYVLGDWNATFVGFVPAQAPQLSGIVVLNHPTPIYGGSVSAPVFSKIMQYALRRFDIAAACGFDDLGFDVAAWRFKVTSLAVLDESAGVAIEKIVERMQPLAVVGQTNGVGVTQVAFDHRSVVRGALFCCLVGEHADGHEFAPKAYRRGAVAFICEHTLGAEVGASAQLVVAPGMARQAMSLAACAFYDDPARKLRMVGVTGTNGKTTTTQFLRDILEVEGWATGVIGTLGGAWTTPESPQLQRALLDLYEKGTVACAMEVTSHALAQHRVDGIQFDVAVFTNLSQDHLDFHQSMEAYFAAKAELFTPERARFAVVNRDDEYGRRLIAKSQIPTVSYSLEDASNLEVGLASSRFRLGGRDVVFPIGGEFNVKNALAAACTARALGVGPDAIVEGLAKAERVPGRFEAVESDNGVVAIVDYARTPRRAWKRCCARCVETRRKMRAPTAPP